MQGTLNTRHKAGARQNASGGIKSQREIMFLSTRSTPVVMIAFTERQSFFSIMDYWRPKFVGRTVRDLIRGEADQLSRVALFNRLGTLLLAK